MKDNCNLLGVSGKANSGKDEIGKIIQYLIAKNNNWKKNYQVDRDYKFTYKQFLAGWNRQSLSGWEIKKFAYKVKQILSILTGIPIEDFEKEEIKNSYLGEEWNRWCVYSMGEWLATYLTKEELLKEWPKSDDYAHRYEEITVRQAMQLVGTDLFRNKFHPNTWVNALFSDYKTLPKEKSGHDNALGMYSCVCSICGSRFSSRNKYQTLCKKHWDETNLLPNWIITDLRFENEAQAILDRGGILIRVNRPELFIQKIKDSEKTGGYMRQEHSSETELDDYGKFHYTIDNNRTVEELIVKVEEILINLKLIDEKKK
ncbi:MAG: hypothetical protein GY775_19230 [Candidatus Scalindua sp.]|nr:hypothetical protein [Candidatus Scalindua sp.]